MTKIFASAAALSLSVAACTAGDPLDGRTVKTDDYKYDSSAVAVFLDFEFDGQLVTTSSWNPNQKIEDQLLYTIGQLNGDDSVGRLDKLELTNVETERTDDGKTHIRYHASMPVAWGDKNDIPDSYTLILPQDMSYEALDSFAEKYGHDCVDWGAHDVDSGSMWYYYRPGAWNCELDEGDVHHVEATVLVSEINTTGKFPEYDEVWKDDQLRVVAVFGKYEDGATTASDAGIAGYNEFVDTLDRELRPFDTTTVPEEVPDRPGVEVPEVTFRAELGDGKSVEVVVILVDNVRTAGAEFDSRYGELSSTADLITYNGHAGLGSNIRALARKGEWVAGQYAIVFMNGCDTYAYVDSALADAHADVNPDDPNGTKYLDIVTNAMPSYFRSMSGATMAIVRGLLSYDAPKTFEQIFTGVDQAQVILVSGEQDNDFVPGGGGTPDEQWDGLTESGTVARDEEHRFATPTLPAGSYRFEITGTRDADLYVRIGAEPTLYDYDCRPYRTGSNEVCTVDLSAPAPIHVMVRGYSASSDYELNAN